MGLRVGVILVGVFFLMGCTARVVVEGPVGAGESVVIKECALEETRAYLETVKKLEGRGDCVLREERFETAIKLVQDATKVSMSVNWAALEAAGVARDTKVTVELRDVPWRRILATILVNGNYLHHIVDEDGVVVVSTRDDLNSTKYQLVRHYDVGVLVNTWERPERRSSIIEEPGKVRPDFDEARNARISELIDTIKVTVAAETWRDAGGSIGSIREQNGVLIVNQTMEHHREIAALLCQMKELAGRRTRVYDVGDLVGVDAGRMKTLMDLVQDLSGPDSWREKGGKLAVMRGLGGRLYVTGPSAVHDELGNLLKLVRESNPRGMSGELVRPTMMRVPDHATTRGSGERSATLPATGP